MNATRRAAIERLLEQMADLEREHQDMLRDLAPLGVRVEVGTPSGTTIDAAPDFDLDRVVVRVLASLVSLNARMALMSGALAIVIEADPERVPDLIVAPEPGRYRN